MSLPATVERPTAVACDVCEAAMVYRLEYLTAELRRWSLSCPAGCEGVRMTGREALTSVGAIACAPGGQSFSVVGKIWVAE